MKKKTVARVEIVWKKTVARVESRTTIIVENGRLWIKQNTVAIVWTPLEGTDTVVKVGALRRADDKYH